MLLTAKAIKQFQEKILSWYANNKRDFPWRHASDPYRIYISEIMSQQTQISRVVSKYEAWIEKFQTTTVLANASTKDVLSLWSGLGYNSRALNILKTAKLITQNYDGIFPSNYDELIILPGIGKYTASAILCFAFNEQIPVIDTNVRKVITHEFFAGVLPDEKTIEEVALAILPYHKAKDWNQALMDYAGAVMKDKKIPVTKQSHFMSSDRYYRGQIIKLLLEVNSINVSGLQDYFANKNSIDQIRLQDILDKMKKNGLLFEKKGLYTLLEQ